MTQSLTLLECIRKIQAYHGRSNSIWSAHRNFLYETSTVLEAKWFEGKDRLAPIIMESHEQVGEEG